MKIKALWIVALMATFSSAPLVSQERGAFRPTDQGGQIADILFGEVIPKPQLVAKVVAPIWGSVLPEPGIFPGVWVKKDQRLAEIVLELNAEERLPLNDRSIEISGYLDRAKQRLRFALEDYQRAVKIQKEHPEFEKELQRRKLIYENALQEFQITTRQESTQKRTEKSRDPKYTYVNAPIDGYITEQHFTPGEINPTDDFKELFTIVDLSTVWVQVAVYEKNLDQFRSQQSISIKSPAHPETSFSGSLRFVGNQVNPQTRTVPVFYEVQNPKHLLKLGLLVEVNLPARSD